MKYPWAFLALTLFSLFSIAHADTYFIKLGYVEKPAALQRVAHLLQKLGFPAYQSDEAGYATIYTGPFTTMSDSRNALAAIQKSIAPDAFIVTFAPPENDCNVSKIEKREPESYGPLFAGVSIGAAFLDIRKSEEPTLHYDPDEKGLSYGILLGYDINDDFFSTLDYRHTRLDDKDLDDFFATINYRITDFYTLSPFIGLLGGYSFMEWRGDPFDATRKDSSSESLIGGGQIGAHTPLYENFQLFTLYRYIFMDHETSVSTHSKAGKIEDRSNQIIEMGIRYDF